MELIISIIRKLLIKGKSLNNHIYQFSRYQTCYTQIWNILKYLKVQDTKIRWPMDGNGICVFEYICPLTI